MPVSMSMSMSAAGILQSYSESHAERYGRVAAAEDASEEVERSVNRWLRDKLSRLGEGALVGDIGCGDGRLVPLLRGAGRTILGVEVSRAMLARVPGAEREGRHAEHGSACTLFATVSIADIQAALRSHSEVYVEGALEELLPELGRHGLQLDAALSSFNAVCFRRPATPVDAIAACLRSDGALYFVSNVIVPSRMLEFGSHKQMLSLHEHLSASTPRQSMFRHVLHTQSGPVPLEDHIHTLPMLAAAFDPNRWRIVEACLFPAEGCEHLHPSDSRYDDALGAAHEDLLPPDAGYTYLKVVVHATRR